MHGLVWCVPACVYVCVGVATVCVLHAWTCMVCACLCVGVATVRVLHAWTCTVCAFVCVCVYVCVRVWAERSHGLV